jgi:hypothetical protein
MLDRSADQWLGAALSTSHRLPPWAELWVMREFHGRKRRTAQNHVGGFFGDHDQTLGVFVDGATVKKAEPRKWRQSAGFADCILPHRHVGDEPYFKGGLPEPGRLPDRASRRRKNERHRGRQCAPRRTLAPSTHKSKRRVKPGHFQRRPQCRRFRERGPSEEKQSPTPKGGVKPIRGGQ